MDAYSRPWLHYYLKWQVSKESRFLSIPLAIPQPLSDGFMSEYQHVIKSPQCTNSPVGYLFPWILIRLRCAANLSQYRSKYLHTSNLCDRWPHLCFAICG